MEFIRLSVQKKLFGYLYEKVYTLENKNNNKNKKHLSTPIVDVYDVFLRYITKFYLLFNYVNNNTNIFDYKEKKHML